MLKQYYYRASVDAVNVFPLGKVAWIQASQSQGKTLAIRDRDQKKCLHSDDICDFLSKRIKEAECIQTRN